MEVTNQKLISILLFLVIGVLLFDNNYFLKKPLHTVVKGKHTEFSAGRKSEYPTYFLTDISGSKYKVPAWLHGYFNIEDSIIVTRSLLFNKAIRIEGYKKGEYIKENIGVLNSNWFGKGFPVFCLALCIVSIFFNGWIKNERLRAAVFFLPIMFMVVIAAFYFFFST